jgi:ABC-type sugar transport system substrate-binding protein
MTSIPKLLAVSTAMLLTAAGLTACSTPGGGGENAVSIAYSVEALDESQSDIVDQMKLRVKQLNDDGAAISLDVFGADNSVDRQITDIESIVTRQTDVLLLTGVDPAGVVSAADAAAAAGVKVVDVRGNLGSDNTFFYAGVDEPAMGDLMVESVRAYLDANPDAVLRFGLIKGAEPFTTTHIRVESLRELADEMPDRVQILVEDYGDWTTERATSLMEDWSVRYPDMNALALSSDEMALGAVNVLKAKNLLTDFPVFSVSGSDNGIAMLQAGEIVSTVGIDFAAYGAGMIDMAVAAASGELEVGDVYSASDVIKLLTADNVDDYAAKKKADAAAAAELN